MRAPTRSARPIMQCARAPLAVPPIPYAVPVRSECALQRLIRPSVVEQLVKSGTFGARMKGLDEFQDSSFMRIAAQLRALFDLSEEQNVRGALPTYLCCVMMC